MPKSLKKSSKPSPSQVDEEVEELRADPTAGKQGAPAPVASVHSAPQPVKRPKRRFAIPVLPGLQIIFELRFLQVLISCLFVYVWSAVTANDFFYLLSAAYGIALVLGVLLPLLQVLDVKAECSMPEQLIVSEKVEMRIRLSRVGIFGPLALFIPIRCLRVVANLSRRSPAGKGSELILDPQPLLISKLDQPSWLTLPTPRLRRGIYFVEQLQVESCFPFGLFWWSRRIKLYKRKDVDAMKITVHPLLLPVSGQFLLQLLALRSTMGLSNSSSIIVPQSSSVRSVREFRPGDSIRHVHWPSSARQGKILVREFDSEQLPVFDLLLDLRANWKTQEQFEVAVCLIHSLMHLGHKLGIMPDLMLNPPLRSQVVQKNLLFDMPGVPYGLEYVSELLARVEPIPSHMDNLPEPDLTPDEEEQEAKDLAFTNIRPLITVIPLLELKAKFSPTRGDHMIAPIDLAIIPRNWQEDDESMKSQRNKNQKSHKPVGRPPNTKVIATIDGEDEFDTL
ncbi:MAG TPA: DUF58 domain-containing protein [Oculatellaceae cyanobacterium]